MPMMIRSFVLVLATSCAMASTSFAASKDAFDAVHCDGDVVKALVGKTIPNTPVEALEKKHAAIQLKDEGGDEISDAISYTGWSICGKSYHVLQRGDTVTDVVAAAQDPKHPVAIGECTANGKKLPGTVFAILDASKKGGTLPATEAWRIDAKRGTFEKIDSAGVECSREDISSADGQE
jgi:hypothetical protein